MLREVLAETGCLEPLTACRPSGLRPATVWAGAERQALPRGRMARKGQALTCPPPPLAAVGIPTGDEKHVACRGRAARLRMPRRGASSAGARGDATPRRSSVLRRMRSPCLAERAPPRPASRAGAHVYARLARSCPTLPAVPWRRRGRRPLCGDNRVACCRVLAGRPGSGDRPPPEGHMPDALGQAGSNNVKAQRVANIAPSWRSLTFPSQRGWPQAMPGGAAVPRGGR